MSDLRLHVLHAEGRCKQDAPDDPRWLVGSLFGAHGNARVARIAEQMRKMVCSSCQVQDVCLDYALDTNQTGIWAGTADFQREEIRKLRS